MLIWILGILDFIAAVVLILLKFNLAEIFGWVFATYLIVKGFVFFSLISLLDILAGILMIFAIFGNFSIFTWLAVIWLMQKIVFSYSKR